MDKSTQKIADKVLAELGEIKKFVRDLVVLPREKQECAQRSEDGSGQRSTQINPNVLTAASPAKFTPSINQASRTAEPNNRCLGWFRRWKPVIETVGLVVVIAYTVIAGLQWRAMSESNRTSAEALNETRANFRKDQRPYVWPAKIEPLPLKVGERVRVSAYYLNYGKTPALKERSTGKVFLPLGADVLVQADIFFSTFKESGMQGGSKIVLPPGILPNPKDSPAFVTDRSDSVISDQKTLDIIEKNASGFEIVGIILYEDSYGTSYRSDYCMMNTGTGLMSWCDRHNEIYEGENRR